MAVLLEGGMNSIIRYNRYMVPSIDSLQIFTLNNNEKTVGKNTENSYPTGSFKQSEEIL